MGTRAAFFEAEVCDFCMVEAERQPYTHLTDRFVIVGDPEWGIPTYSDMDGEWAVCARCHGLILDNNRDALEAAFTDPSAPAWFPIWRRQMLDAFWAHYHGRWRIEGASAC